MGNGLVISNTKTNDEMNVAWLKWMMLYQRINLGRVEFDAIYSFFCSLEKPNRPGYVLLSDLETVLAFKANIFLARCFAIFEDDWAGYTDFGEFTVCLWNFCTHTPTTLLFYSFQIFPDETGTSNNLFTKDEIVAILWTLHWSEENEQNGTWEKMEASINHNFTHANSSGISMESFDELFPFSSVFMLPVQRLRQSVFKRVLAEKYWKKSALQPIMTDDGEAMTVVQFKRRVSTHIIQYTVGAY
jgi:hypothetical protein